jgi:hypothetical protein
MGLEELARHRQMTVEALVQEVIVQYVQAHMPQPSRYSFIGIGHSGRGNLSTQVDTLLEQAAQRQEGWSLP